MAEYQDSQLYVGLKKAGDKHKSLEISPENSLFPRYRICGRIGTNRTINHSLTE